MNQNTQELARRMRALEEVPKTRLDENVPVIIRIDGRSFKNFTKPFERPYDEVFRRAMRNTMLAMCSHIQNCCLGYNFSDEISLLLIRHQGASAWFDNELEKIVSSTASYATMTFNQKFAQSVTCSPDSQRYADSLWKACFDARAFNIPEDSLDDYFLWRQTDCIRNSVTAAVLALPGYDANTLQMKKLPELLQILQAAGTPWDNYFVQDRYGSFAVRERNEMLRYANGHMQQFTRTKWVIPTKTPQLRFEKTPFVATYLERYFEAK